MEVKETIWKKCLEKIEESILPDSYATWFSPTYPQNLENGLITIAVPNQFYRKCLIENYRELIESTLKVVANESILVDFCIESEKSTPKEQDEFDPLISRENKPNKSKLGVEICAQTINPKHTFSNFVVGSSNQFAHAAALAVANNPSMAYNPLFIYGGVGLGKTHLMHAIGNKIKEKNPNMKITYAHSEKFVSDMVKSLQLGAISEFKQHYRSLDALLIDDIQFFANKEQSQEELFHTFNSLLERGSQMILTCDRYPKEIDGLEDRLKSRLGWGLPVIIDPPELETRVAILLSKAESLGQKLDTESAFFIAQKVRSNVRELEGALKRVIASSNFTGSKIDIGLIKDSLKDLLAIQARQVSVDNIQKTVAEYYNVKLSDLLSKRRSRSVARPRQMSMFLAKELTNHSLPEIGESFGGRDHTTVLHACKKIKELRDFNNEIEQDYRNLVRALTI